jgi:hypothetical protein
MRLTDDVQVNSATLTFAGNILSDADVLAGIVLIDVDHFQASSVFR